MVLRQKMLLSLLWHAGRRISHSKLTNLAFLFTREHEFSNGRDFYQFVPCDVNPLSFTLLHDIEVLKKNGILTANEEDLLLPAEINCSKFSIDSYIDKVLQSTWLTYYKLSPDELQNKVREQYIPDIADHECDCDSADRHPIYTAGYEGLQVEGFLNRLLRYDIKQIIDVRSNPVSHVYGFHKSTLSSICKQVGITYCHVPKLGIPSSMRNNLEGLSDYERIFELYEKEIIPQQMDLVDQTAQQVLRTPTVLMCMESDPEYCHRSRLAKVISLVSKLCVEELEMKTWEKSIKEQKSLLP